MSSDGIRSTVMDVDDHEWLLMTDELSVEDADDSGRWIAQRPTSDRQREGIERTKQVKGIKMRYELNERNNEQ